MVVTSPAQKPKVMVKSKPTNCSMSARYHRFNDSNPTPEMMTACVIATGPRMAAFLVSSEI
jgi:hypothetical protein